MHQVLEAKLLGPADTVVSIATEFIDNSDAQSVPAGASQEQLKQDCELKALRRLMAGLRGEFPRLRICLDGDSLYACGEGFQIAKDYKCDYIYVFKPGRTPAPGRTSRGCCGCAPASRWSGRRRRGFARSIAGSTACATPTATTASDLQRR